jgi:hypothetical protein
MTRLTFTAGTYVFPARLELAKAPRTCTAFAGRLPFESRLIHVRWSGEAVWMPLGDLDWGVPFEDPTSHPAPGEVLLYPGGPGALSESEILVGYGAVRFASKAGQLAGNHFMTIEADRTRLAELGRKVLWEGALPVRIEAAD